MSAYFLLALPRLHAELSALPEGGVTFWPGLPRRPENAWAPALPWSPALAAACLADYERACRDGASGTPVHALGAAHAQPDLSDAERRALREMAGMPAEEPEQPLRQTAQQVLLLAWLQEKQALDMAELEKKIHASRSELHRLISGRIRTGESSGLPAERELPGWQKMLAAILAFLPDMPEPAAFWIDGAEMAQALAEIPAEAVPAQDAAALPAHGRAVQVKASVLVSLCGRSAAERLTRELGQAQLARPMVLVFPACSA